MHLPIELVECIIDASVAHLPTVSACSLVCKQWLPRCRHHLFSLLNLSADWTPEPNSVTDFLALLRAPHATLIPYIRAVVVSKRSWGMTPVAHILAGLARAGVHPRALFVSCPTYEPTHAPLFAASLTHLVLELHNDMPAALLMDHICAFPRLESLDVGGSARFTVDEAAQYHHCDYRALPRRLHTLIVRNTVVLEWLTSLPDPAAPGTAQGSSITTLVIKHIRLPEQWVGIQRYFTSVNAAGIRALAFHGCDFSLSPPPPLHRLADLQVLTIECTPAATTAHLSLLQQLPARAALETLSLRLMNALLGLSTTAAAVGDPAAWEAADARLGDAARFPALERVHVNRAGVGACASTHRATADAGFSISPAKSTEYYLCHTLPRPVADLVCRVMPQCVRRGVLVA